MISDFSQPAALESIAQSALDRGRLFVEELEENFIRNGTSLFLIF